MISSAVLIVLTQALNKPAHRFRVVKPEGSVGRSLVEAELWLSCLTHQSRQFAKWSQR